MKRKDKRLAISLAVVCSLAIGTPKDIRKWHNGGSYFEGWVCDNGNYLIFIDGVLSEIH